MRINLLNYIMAFIASLTIAWLVYKIQSVIPDYKFFVTFSGGAITLAAMTSFIKSDN